MGSIAEINKFGLGVEISPHGNLHLSCDIKLHFEKQEPLVLDAEISARLKDAGGAV